MFMETKGQTYIDRVGAFIDKRTEIIPHRAIVLPNGS